MQEKRPFLCLRQMIVYMFLARVAGTNTYEDYYGS
jgi:hypothetical protein